LTVRRTFCKAGTSTLPDLYIMLRSKASIALLADAFSIRSVSLLKAWCPYRIHVGCCICRIYRTRSFHFRCQYHSATQVIKIHCHLQGRDSGSNYITHIFANTNPPRAPKSCMITDSCRIMATNNLHEAAGDPELPISSQSYHSDFSRHDTYECL
jgi:hypothetical protein